MKSLNYFFLGVSLTLLVLLYFAECSPSQYNLWIFSEDTYDLMAVHNDLIQVIEVIIIAVFSVTLCTALFWKDKDDDDDNFPNSTTPRKI